MREALEKGGLQPTDLAAVGITNQRETTLLWDRRTGKPLHNALVWQDTRVDRLVAEFARDGGRDRFRDQTGLPLASYFSRAEAALAARQRARRPARRPRPATCCSARSTRWLVWNLTGGAEGGLHVTDVTNASRTQLMNLETLDWDDGMLADLRHPAGVLPRIVSSSEVYGETKAPFAGVPIAGILGDQQAALVGQACFAPGEAKNTYGTGCFLLMNTGEEPVPSKAGLVTTVAYSFGGQKPALRAGRLDRHHRRAGAVAARQPRPDQGSSAEVETLAATVEDNGDVYFVPAFSGLYAPYWREDARGVIAGLTRYANRGHIARAALEATAYQTRDVVEAMAAGFRHPDQGAARRRRHGGQRHC